MLEKLLQTEVFHRRRKVRCGTLHMDNVRTEMVDEELVTVFGVSKELGKVPRRILRENRGMTRFEITLETSKVVDNTSLGEANREHEPNGLGSELHDDGANSSYFRPVSNGVGGEERLFVRRETGARSEREREECLPSVVQSRFWLSRY
jgi:hypothetical protein